MRQEILGWVKHAEGEDLAEALRGMFARDNPPAMASQQGNDVALGDQFGVFRIEKLLGSGGMGSVYLASRTDGLEGYVALKILHYCSSKMAAAFHDECKLLSSLKHSNISHLIDVGVSRGVSWMAMEYVEGLNLDAYVKQHNVGLSKRINLFLQICDALTHAHHQMIIHRDLKPGNIMVTPQGRVKLLDFGIASLLDPDTGEQRILTKRAERMMTPEYASPEQINGLRLSVNSDVYSLGIILYEMLTGVRPYTFKSHNAIDIARHVNEVPIIKPSARRDASNNATFARKLRGDIDTIVLKALERDRDRRYPSVSSLATDLHSYLNGQPISARPATPSYRLRKYMQRNPWPMAMGSLSALFLFCFALYANHQRYINAQERDLARKEQQTAQMVTGFLSGMFEQIDPDLAGDGEITAFQVMEEGRRRLHALQTKPEVSLQLKQTMGSVYGALGKHETALDLYEQIETDQKKLGIDTFETVLHLVEMLLASGKPGAAEDRILSLEEKLVEGDAYQHTRYWHTRGKVLVARSQYPLADKAFAMAFAAAGYNRDQLMDLKTDQAGLLLSWGSYQKAFEQFEEILAHRRQRLGDNHSKVAGTLMAMASSSQGLANYERADLFYAQVNEIYETIYKSDHPMQANLKMAMAELAFTRGDFKAAKSLYQEALAIREKVLGEDHPKTAQCLRSLGWLSVELADYQAANSLLRKVLKSQMDNLGEEHEDVARTIQRLGLLFKLKGEYEEAGNLLTKALLIRRRVLGEEHPDTADSYNDKGVLHQEMGRLDSAISYQEQALAIRKRVLGEEHPTTALSLNNMAVLHQKMGDFDRAIPYQKQALAIRLKILGEEHPDSANALNNLGAMLRGKGNLEEARPYYERALATRKKVLGVDHPSTAASLNSMGALLKGMGDLEEARHYFEQALSIWKKVLGEEHPSTAASLCNMGVLLNDMGDLEEAKRYFEQALHIFETSLGPKHKNTETVRNYLTDLEKKLSGN